MADPYQTRGPLPDKGHYVIGAAIAAIVASTVAVILRGCSRAMAKAGFWWDDWLIIVSLPFTWALIGLDIGWVSAGLGKHIWSPGVKPVVGFKLLFASELVYDTSITLIRMSAVLFYYRIFGRDRWFKIALWVTAGMLIAWWIAINVLAIFQCSPVARQWDYSIPGHCFSLYGTFMGVTIPNVFIDFLILVLPLPMLWRLHINLRKKLALIVNFVLGYSVIIVTIFRLLSVIRVPADASEDVTWNSTTCAVLFMVEPAVATVSICLPSIWSLLTYGFKRFPSDSFHTAWTRRSSRKSDNSKRTEESTPTPYAKQAFKFSDSPKPTMAEKHTFIDVEERGSPFSQCSSPVPGQRPEHRKGSVTRSMEIEARVRDYYNRAAFDHGSRETVEQYWDRGDDLEMGRSLAERNPLPVPPKGRLKPTTTRRGHIET